MRLCAIAARIVLAAALGAAGLGVWAFAIEPASLRTREYELTIPAWPAACDGMRVAVLADLHVGSPWNGLDRLAEVVAETNASRPDLVLLAGDYVIQRVPGGTYVPPEAIAEGLRGLEAPLGRFAVLGNHERVRGSDRVRSALEAAGIRVLEDEATPVGKTECSFWLAGFRDLGSRHDVAGALAQVSDARPVLGLTHNPDLFPTIPARVSLTVAGHTHGGQVHLPFLGRPYVSTATGDRYAIGHVVESGRHLFVNPGIGTSVLPVRFRVPPEISVLVLRPTAERRPA